MSDMSHTVAEWHQEWCAK